MIVLFYAKKFLSASSHNAPATQTLVFRIFFLGSVANLRFFPLFVRDAIVSGSGQKPLHLVRFFFVFCKFN